MDLLEHILYEPLYDQVRQLQRIVRTKSDSANTKYTSLQSASICLYYIYSSNLASTSICSHSLEHSYGRKNNLEVSCGARFTASVIGMSFRLVSAAKSAVRVNRSVRCL